MYKYVTGQFMSFCFTTDCKASYEVGPGGQPTPIGPIFFNLYIIHLFSKRNVINVNLSPNFFFRAQPKICSRFSLTALTNCHLYKLIRKNMMSCMLVFFARLE